MTSSNGPLEGLLRRLDLEVAGNACFVGVSGKGRGALFGGMVAAQAVAAAGRDAGGRRLHSLHGYFLRPGEHGVPIRFHVTRLRDGRTFTTRAVLAEQSGQPIFSCTVDFTRHEEGISHQQERMPEAPEPPGLEEWEDMRAALGGDPSARRADGPIEVRVCDPDSADPSVALPARRRVWLRPRGTVPDDPLLRAALLVYASDRTLLRTAARPHGAWQLRTAASLDHAVWLHRPPCFDDWILYASESPVAHGGRALLLGAMYTRDGTRIATVAQEGLLRYSVGGRCAGASVPVCGF